MKWLLITNVAIFIVWYFTQSQLRELWLDLALVPAFVVHLFMVWQLATYMFLHGSFSHILWNMLALWMFGADVEQALGTRRFLQFYFFCGIGAGVCVVAVNYLTPWGDPAVPTIGASGAIFGILLAYAMMFPKRTLLFAFLIPIQARWFVLIIGAIAFMSAFGTVNSNVNEFAHLGGLLFAFIYMKMPRGSLDLAGPIQRWYRDWKLQRAKKKFQVYLRKQGSDRDPWVH